MQNATTKQVDVTKVMSVYRGKAGNCCCGCSGRHSYASAHVAAASKNRGYEVASDEVSDRRVQNVVNDINDHPSDIQWEADFASLEINGRLLVAYFVASV